MRHLPTQAPDHPPRVEDCAALFDCSLEAAEQFLDELRIPQLRDAFRRRAFALHPDRARAQGELVDERTRAFRRLSAAYERLCHAVRAREGTRRPRAAPQPAQGLATQGLATQGLATQGLDAPSLPAQGLATQGLDAQGLPAEPLLLGQYLHYSGRVSRDAVEHALLWQRGLRSPFGVLAQQWSFLSDAQVQVIRRARRPGERIGDAGRRLGYLRPEQCETLLWAQRQAHRKLGQFFVEAGLLTAAELCVLVEALRQHNRAVTPPGRRAA